MQTNPTPLGMFYATFYTTEIPNDGVRRTEPLINRDPHVAAAVMSGRGKFNPGLLVDPKPEYKFNRDDQDKLAAFRNAIW